MREIIRCHSCGNEAFISIKILETGKEAFFCEMCFVDKFLPSIGIIGEGLSKSLKKVMKL